MATNEPTTVTRDAPNGKFTNPRAIEWPYDQHGFTTLLRKEGVRAVGRIKGDKAKLDVLIQTLKVLGEHARAKIADQMKDAAQTAAARQNREAAEYARSLADQKAEVARLKRLLASAEAAVEAKEAMPAKGDA